MYFMDNDIRTRFGYRFVLLARLWRRVIDAELARSGLTDATWAPLIHLDEGGDDITQTELATRMGLDGSGLVRLLDLLEARALIARRIDPDDRRARRLFLTEAGRGQIALIRARLSTLEHEMLRDIDARTMEQIMAGFDRLEQRLRALDPKSVVGTEHRA